MQKKNLILNPNSHSLQRIENMDLLKNEPQSFRKYFMEHLKKDIISSIHEIVCKIHKVAFSGDYLRRDIEGKIGTMVTMSEFDPEARMPQYRSCAYKQHEELKLTLFYNPIDGFIPQCRIEVSYPSQNWIYELIQFFPKLRISLIEYTTDFLFSCREDESAFFWLFRHYAWFPRQSSDKIYDKGVNRTVRVGRNIRYYERGAKNRNLKNPNDLKVFRFEYTLRGSSLLKWELKNPLDFIADAKFSDIIESRLYFKTARPLTKLMNKESEYCESLMKEYQMKRIAANNFSQVLINADGFVNLIEKWKNAMYLFDEQWKEDRKAIKSWS
jgi:hypothetical protein